MTEPLILHLKGIFFDQIKAGIKSEEYREVKPYWITRLEGKTFSSVIIIRGYPAYPLIIPTNRLDFPWRGYEKKIIFFPLTDKRTYVYAIKLEKEGTKPKNT